MAFPLCCRGNVYTPSAPAGRVDFSRFYPKSSRVTPKPYVFSRGFPGGSMTVRKLQVLSVRHPRPDDRQAKLPMLRLENGYFVGVIYTPFASALMTAGAEFFPGAGRGPSRVLPSFDARRLLSPCSSPSLLPAWSSPCRRPGAGRGGAGHRPPGPMKPAAVRCGAVRERRAAPPAWRRTRGGTHPTRPPSPGRSP